MLEGTINVMIGEHRTNADSYEANLIAASHSAGTELTEMPSTPTVLTVCEVAQILRLGKISVYQAIDRGDIPCIRIGRRILIPRHALEQLLKNPRPVPRPAAQQ
jgi:excisionase family DNA binding protein